VSASGLPLALRQTFGPTRFSQIKGPDAPILFEKCGLGLQIAGFADEDARLFAVVAAIRDLLAWFR
jgi:hypothetical protein